MNLSKNLFFKKSTHFPLRLFGPSTQEHRKQTIKTVKKWALALMASLSIRLLSYSNQSVRITGDYLDLRRLVSRSRLVGLGFVFGVDSFSRVADISDIAVVVISSVGHSLDTAIGEGNSVRSRDSFACNFANRERNGFNLS